MPRPATISYEDFAAAARELNSSGQRLTFSAVRLKLGGGSYDVLRRYIDRYAEEEPNRDGAAGLPEALRGGMQALYDQALAEATKQVRSELEADAQALASDREVMQAESAELQRRLAQAETEARLMKDRVDELQAEREQLHQRVDVERQRVLDLEVRLASAQGALASERETRRALADQAAQERQQLADRFAGDLQRAEQRFDGLQQHALRRVDELRTQHLARVEQLLEQSLAAATQQRAAREEAAHAIAERLAQLMKISGTAAAGVVTLESTLGASIASIGERLEEQLSALVRATDKLLAVDAAPSLQDSAKSGRTGALRKKGAKS